MARRLRTAKRGHPKYDGYTVEGIPIPWSMTHGKGISEGPIFNDIGQVYHSGSDTWVTPNRGGGHPAHGVARAMTEQGMNPLLALMAAFQAYNDHPNFGGGQGQGGIDFGSFFQRPAPPTPPTPEQQARWSPYIMKPQVGPYQGPPLKPSAPMIPDGPYAQGGSNDAGLGLPPAVTQALGAQ